MVRLLFLIVSVALAQEAAGQTCTHTDLSKEFTFRSALTPAKASKFQQNERYGFKAYGVTIGVTSRLTKGPPQLIQFETGPLFDSAYYNCNAVRSYSTGKNRDADAPDNDYGDFIVADFNFDGRDDFAAKNESGGNAGPYYNFYVQLASGKFVWDDFLTVEMQFFPSNIDKVRRTLTTQAHAGANGLGETVFHLNKAGKWAQMSHRVLPMNAR